MTNKDKIKYVKLDALHVEVSGKILTTIKWLNAIFKLSNTHINVVVSNLLNYSFNEYSVNLPIVYLMFGSNKQFFCIYEVINMLQEKIDFLKRKQKLILAHHKEKFAYLCNKKKSTGLTEKELRSYNSRRLLISKNNNKKYASFKKHIDKFESMIKALKKYLKTHGK